MIAAVIHSNLLFNWFDVALVLMLGFGFWRGRKHGMTKEFIPFFRWMFIIILAGFGYSLLGNLLVQSDIIKSMFGRRPLQITTAYITSYLIIAGIVWLVFIYIGRLLKPKLEHSSIFGSSEYYLGILAGTLRYACISLFALSLLHAPYYTSQDIAADKAYKNRWYGGGMRNFSGDFIPSVYEAQSAAFDTSLFGPFIDKHLSLLLINSRPTVVVKEPVVDIEH